LQLPAALPQGRIRSDGYRAELQYVAPHDEDQGYYWGFNLEAARFTHAGEPAVWNIEVIPILGLRVDRWHLIANPGLSRALSGPARRVNLEWAAKASYQAAGSHHLGVEYYEDAGPLRKLLPAHRRYSVLYLVWNGKIGKSDLNIGLGRGLNSASDRFVFKT